MGIIRNEVARQFIAVPDDKKGQIVFKWPDVNIRKGARAIVEPDAVAVFVNANYFFQVYDLSTALELDWYEDLGFCGPGEAEKLLRDGVTQLDGRLPVNPSGGLACFGEAVPAQAIAQVCEITWQLRGQAEGRQVADPTVGITANQGLFGHGSSVILTR